MRMIRILMPMIGYLESHLANLMGNPTDRSMSLGKPLISEKKTAMMIWIWSYRYHRGQVWLTLINGANNNQRPVAVNKVVF